MIKKIITLFKIARKIAQSDILNMLSEFYKIPKLIKYLFYVLSFSFSNPNKLHSRNSDQESLCNSIQEMGTTFIKLGQFLSTRPDIIGDQIAK